ncbi:MAG: hypothetical protein KC516_02340 [Nanoarchaeota archaeon]|nr:hypothetical protein [Nanoarchaeota archaeon]
MLEDKEEIKDSDSFEKLREDEEIDYVARCIDFMRENSLIGRQYDSPFSIGKKDSFDNPKNFVKINSPFAVGERQYSDKKFSLDKGKD